MIFGKKITKYFGIQNLFTNADFQVNPTERIGIVGRNGYGKSTLFQLILGTAIPDDGEISYPEEYRVGGLDQHMEFTKPTIREEVTQILPSEQEYDHWKAEKLLAGLGFSTDDFAKPASVFSGGFQIRIKLAQLLLSEPDCLLLDEPTNYLDIVSIRWLESFLRGWRGELLCISHDETFLENISTHTIAIHRQKFKKIKGSPSKCYTQIAREEEVYEKTRQNDAKSKAKQEKFIREFRSGARSAGLVQSRIKMLEKKENLSVLPTIPSITFRFPELDFTGDKVLGGHNLSFGYEGGQDLLKKITLEVFPGEKVGIIGPNGKGKTTLLNVLSDYLYPQEGTLKRNNSLVWGYFGQSNINRLDPKKNIIEELMIHSDASEQYVRAIAGNLLFSGDLAYKKIEILSGGEKARVNLGKIFVKNTNLLFLDEPTNHLDYESVRALEEAIMAYQGAVVFVSHNEHFLRKIAEKLVVFDREEVFVFRGGYEEFIREKGFCVEQLEHPTTLASGTKENKSRPDDRMKQKKLQMLLRPLHRKFSVLEREIVAIEAAQKENKDAFAVAVGQGSRLKMDSLGVAYQALQRELEVKMEEWERVGRDMELVENKY